MRRSFFTRQRLAWATSLGCHGIVLLLVGAFARNQGLRQSTFSNVIVDTSSSVSSEASRTEAQTPLNHAALVAEITLLPNSSSETVVSADSAGINDLVLEHFSRAQDAAQQRSAEEQLRNLDAAAKRLSALSNQQSVEDISKTLNRALDVAPTQSTTTDPTAPFDIMTAQIVDAREEKKDGRTRYFARMEDAQGKAEDVEVDSTVGKQLVDTFALIKKYPLLETLYRKTVIGLLNKLLNEQRKPPSTLRDNPNGQSR